MILEPGPAELLNVTRCNCMLSTKTPCGVAKTVYLVLPPVGTVMETIAPTFQS